MKLPMYLRRLGRPVKLEACFCVVTVIHAFHVACSKSAIELPWVVVYSGVAFCYAPCFQHLDGVAAISVIIYVCPLVLPSKGSLY